MQSTIKIIGIIVLAYFGLVELYNVMLLVIFSLLISSIYSIFNLIKINLPLQLNLISTKELKDMLKFSSSANTSTLRGFVAGWIDTAILGYYSSPKDVSGYNATVSLMRNVINIITSTLNSAFTSHLAKRIGEGKKGTDLFSEVVRLNMYLSLALVITFSILSEDIMGVLFPKYIEYSFLIPIFSIGFFAFSVSGVIRATLFAMRWAKPLFYIAILVIISNLLLDLILIPYYGVTGAVIATVIAYVLEMVSSLFYVFKKYSLEKKTLNPFVLLPVGLFMYFLHHLIKSFGRVTTILVISGFGLFFLFAVFLFLERHWITLIYERVKSKINL